MSVTASEGTDRPGPEPRASPRLTSERPMTDFPPADQQAVNVDVKHRDDCWQTQLNKAAICGRASRKVEEMEALINGVGKLT